MSSSRRRYTAPRAALHRHPAGRQSPPRQWQWLEPRWADRAQPPQRSAGPLGPARTPQQHQPDVDLVIGTSSRRAPGRSSVRRKWQSIPRRPHRQKASDRVEQRAHRRIHVPGVPPARHRYQPMGQRKPAIASESAAAVATLFTIASTSADRPPKLRCVPPLPG